MANTPLADGEKSSLKGLLAWALYDWANSSYFVIIQTFIFAAYFTKTIAINVEVGTAQWANMISLAGLVIAIGAPILVQLPIKLAVESLGLLFLLLFVWLAVACYGLQNRESILYGLPFLWVLLPPLGRSLPSCFIMPCYQI